MSWSIGRVCRRDIEGRTVLFSEEAQKLVALDDSALRLWRNLEFGLPGDNAERAPSSLDEESPDAVRKALATWTGARRQQPAGAQTDDAEFFRAVSRRVEMGLAAIRINLGKGVPTTEIWRQLAHFPDRAGYRSVTLSVRRNRVGAADPRESFGLWRGDRLILRCSEQEIIPALRMQLTVEVLHAGVFALALHAAALCVGDKLLILTGPPGVGKSTLTVALLAAGYGFAADDLVLLDGDGVARGVPLWPGLKRGSWDLSGAIFGAATGAVVHRRLDGREVRYLDPGTRKSQARRQVGWIVTLDGQPSDASAPCLRARDPLDTLAILMAGAYVPGEKLTEEGFHALATLVSGAQCHSIARRSPDEMVDAIRGMVG